MCVCQAGCELYNLRDCLCLFSLRVPDARRRKGLRLGIWENSSHALGKPNSSNHLDRNQKPPGLWTSLEKNVCVCFSVHLCVMHHRKSTYLHWFHLKLFVCTALLGLTSFALTWLWLNYTHRFSFFIHIDLVFLQKSSTVFDRFVKNTASTSELRFRLTALWSVACSISLWVTDSLMYLNSRGDIKRRDTYISGGYHITIVNVLFFFAFMILFIISLFVHSFVLYLFIYIP